MYINYLSGLGNDILVLPFSLAARSSRKSDPTAGTRRTSSPSRLVSPPRTASFLVSLSLRPSTLVPAFARSRSHRLSPSRTLRARLFYPLLPVVPAGSPPPSNSHGLSSVQCAAPPSRFKSLIIGHLLDTCEPLQVARPAFTVPQPISTCL